MTPGDEIRIRYHRPPDRTQLFRQTLVLERPDLIVTLATGVALPSPVMVDGRVALDPGADAVWFTFPGAWHDIGRFHRSDGTFTGIYANVLTPPVLDGPEWRTTDLFLDVWIPAAGGDAVLLDEDEFDAAVEAGHVGADTARRARLEARTLLERAASGAWPPPDVETWTRARCLELLG